MAEFPDFLNYGESHEVTDKVKERIDAGNIGPLRDRDTAPEQPALPGRTIGFDSSIEVTDKVRDGVQIKLPGTPLKETLLLKEFLGLLAAPTVGGREVLDEEIVTKAEELLRVMIQDAITQDPAILEAVTELVLDKLGIQQVPGPDEDEEDTVLAIDNDPHGYLWTSLRG